MGLSPGTRLGPYELIAAAGAGGMGEVYRARDTRLNRIVAIKILPTNVQQDADRRQRFLREAEAVAALTHPHICTLHDIGYDAGVDYLVMEHLDGETLAVRLERGSLPLDQALRFAVEIAEALDNAHRHAIVHRDLKPANVMLTKAGAKLLDFGLAKLRPAVVAPAGASMPTQEAPITGKGTILGTLHYMAPEHLEGRDADARSDVFAFGAVLYEMLTAQRAFGGSSQASIVAAILDREPAAVSTLRPMTPLILDQIVRRCLAKNPDERWQSAADLAFALKSVEPDSGSVTSGTARAAPRTKAARWAWVAAGTAALLAAALLIVMAVSWTRLESSRPPLPPVRLLLSEQLAIVGGDPIRAFAVSRDGTRVAYVAAAGETRQLYLHDMRALRATPTAGTENASLPFFSPEGGRVGFFAGGQLKAVSLSGGTPVTLAVAPLPRGATWGPNDTIIFSPAIDAGLWRVPASGGSPQLIVQPDPSKGERSYRWPEMLPDDDGVVFTVCMSDTLTFDDAHLVVRSLSTGEQHEILGGGTSASYSETGDLLYTRAGALFAVPFDLRRRAVTGTSRPVVNGVATSPLSGSSQYMLASNGTLLYIAGKAETPERVLSWVTKDGSATRIAVQPQPYQSVGISPDGSRAALDIDGANANIWILDFDRETLTRLTHEWSNNAGRWTPDGAHVVFSSARNTVRTLYWQRIDGQGGADAIVPSTFTLSSFFNTNSTWTSDSRFVIFDALSPATGRDLWTVDVNGDRAPRALLQTTFNESWPALSHNNRWLAYVSNESGSDEVYVQRYSGPGRKIRISVDGGTRPVWSRDSRELYFQRITQSSAFMMGVTLDMSSGLPSRPKVLFERGTQGVYDVAADGRFLVIDAVPTTQPARPITVVLNWRPEPAQ